MLWAWLICFPGQQAKRVFNEAQSLLRKIISEGLLSAHGIVGLFPARRVDDDIQVLGEDGKAIATLYGLREQVSCS